MSLAETGLTVLWRGFLGSCNYACGYCPFAKTEDDRAALAADRASLERFEAWVASRPYIVSILFTPWGEALIRNYYREAFIRLSLMANVATVAVQTNLSCSVGWLERCDLRTAALWISYHPSETPRARFLHKIWRLATMDVRHSVGVVGLREHFGEIEALRRELPRHTYLWINAFKRAPGYYTVGEVERLTGVDPLFELNNRDYSCRGRACRAGETVIAVAADGTARRCHFLPGPIGNIYAPGFETTLTPHPCTAERCRCHIGYSHLKALALPELFGGGLLERRPAGPLQRADALRHMVRFDRDAAASQVSTAGW